MGMPMRHRLSPLASQDVARPYRQSILKFGLAHADRYLCGLEATFASIAKLPEASPERADLSGVRIKRYEARHIFYQIAQNEIVVVRVRHGRQDAARHLKP